MQNEQKIYVVGFGAVAILISLGIFLYISMLHSFIPFEITDLREYQKILEAWSKAGITKEFPSAVPASALKVRMSCLAPFLQGGGHFQLRLKLPPEEIDAIDKKYSSSAIQVYRGKTINERYNQPIPSPSDFTNGKSDGHFHPSFNLYILMALDQGGKDYAWNHGKSYGIAVSRERSEVIYWCESW